MLKSGSFTFDWEQINANTFLLEFFYICVFLKNEKKLWEPNKLYIQQHMQKVSKNSLGKTLEADILRQGMHRSCCLSLLIFNLSLPRLRAPAEPVWLYTKLIPAAPFIYWSSMQPAHSPLLSAFSAGTERPLTISFKSLSDPPLWKIFIFIMLSFADFLLLNLVLSL